MKKYIFEYNNKTISVMAHTILEAKDYIKSLGNDKYKFYKIQIVYGN